MLYSSVVQIGGIEPAVPSLEDWSSAIDIDLREMESLPGIEPGPPPWQGGTLP